MQTLTTQRSMTQLRWHLDHMHSNFSLAAACAFLSAAFACFFFFFFLFLSLVSLPSLHAGLQRW